jgi:hypothetical protein
MTYRFSKDWHGNFDLSTFDFPWDGQAGLEVPPRTFYVVRVLPSFAPPLPRLNPEFRDQEKYETVIVGVRIDNIQ